MTRTSTVPVAGEDWCPPKDTTSSVRGGLYPRGKWERATWPPRLGELGKGGREKGGDGTVETIREHKKICLERE